MILVTGASGFVGGALVRKLNSDCSFNGVVAAVRSKVKSLPQRVQQFLVGGLFSATDWSVALQGVDVIVHCAARVHLIKDDVINPLQAYCEMNVSGTLNLANQAAYSGVRRFVYISSIKVNGEITHSDQSFTADDIPAPLDPYGVSKLQAEQGLREIEAQTGMEVVIVRPPLVYGFGVKANFAYMMQWVARGIPLPFGAIHNARSMVALDNLVDLLVTCVKHPAAAGQTFLVSDGEDLSTTELLRRTAKAMGKRVFLLPVPAFIVEWGLTFLGKRDIAQRLCGSLQLDISKTRQILGWSPLVSVDEGLWRAAQDFRL